MIVVKPSTYLAFIIALAVMFGGPAQAQPMSASGWRVTVGPGFIVGPRYLGSDDMRVLPIPVIDIRKDSFFLNGRDGLGLDLLRDPSGLRAGVSVFARFGRKEKDDPVALAGMGDIDPVPQIRAFAAHRIGPVRISAQVARDLGGSRGVTLDLDASASTALSERVILSGGPQLSFGDARFTRAFFGITAAQGLAGRRAPYAVDAGLYQAGVGASLIVRLDDRWSATAISSVTRLTGAFARSPVVTDRTQKTGGLFLAYTF